MASQTARARKVESRTAIQNTFVGIVTASLKFLVIGGLFATVTNLSYIVGTSVSLVMFFCVIFAAISFITR